MRIEFERSGGFAGLLVRASVDTAALPANEAGQLEEWVEQAGFFSLPERLRGAPSAADRFLYRLTIESGDRRHTVEMGESAVPPALSPLVDWLTDAARRRGRPPP